MESGPQARSKMNDEPKFARINSNGEIEPCSLEDWWGSQTILKETIDEWTVTLSFTGMLPDVWEVSEYNKRRHSVMVYNYPSEDGAIESFFGGLEQVKSGQKS